MSRTQQPFEKGTVRKMQKLLGEARTSAETKRIQCILFRELEHLDAKRIGALVGLSESYVRAVWEKYKRGKEQALMGEKRGKGRYRAHLSLEEEKKFLEPLIDNAKNGHILIAGKIQKAYEEKLKKEVHHSLIYRLLHRHGWRKIAPRPSHPKSDAKAREDFKALFPPVSGKSAKRSGEAKQETAGDVSG